MIFKAEEEGVKKQTTTQTKAAPFKGKERDADVREKSA